MDGIVEEVLSVAEMTRADRLAVAAGVPAERLMEAAGRAVAMTVAARWTPRSTIVLAGPGNNGGDGFVAARYLRAAGWSVRVALIGERGALKGEAALNAERWSGPLVPLSIAALDGAALVIDAMFGAGLTRPLTGAGAEVAREVTARRLPCVAVDVPSGLRGDDGAMMQDANDGMVLAADVTVTFCRKKPGHLLLPGRALCGEVVVADIGIPPSVLDEIAPSIWENGPSLWGERFPWPGPSDHKYARGHLVVCGGAEMTGAARLAARAGQRCGAGMVSIALPPEARQFYSGDLLSVLLRPIAELSDFQALMADSRVRAVVVGPGGGVTAATRAYAKAAMEGGKACVLDADAISVFSERPQGPADFFEAVAANQGRCVITPHDGEFARLFDGLGLPQGSRLERARAAARLSGAIVLVKGYDTVIAAPDGRAVINSNAPPTLATAGAGDILAGAIGGLLAQGMTPFDAACAGAWLHGEAATCFGPGLIAEDLLTTLPAALRALSDRTSTLKVK